MWFNRNKQFHGFGEPLSKISDLNYLKVMKAYSFNLQNNCSYSIC